MEIAALCRRIRDNDASLKEVELEDYSAQKIDKVLKALRERSGSSLGVDELVLRHCQFNVETFTALLLHFCRRHDEPMMNFNSALSPLKSLDLCLHEVNYNIPSDEIAFRLFRGIATDNPPGLADLQTLYLCVGGLSEQSMTALQRVLEKPSSVLSKLDLTNGDKWVDDSAVAKICRGLASNATGTRLSILHLGGNQIGNAGVQHLASMLKHNSILEELYLGLNEIGDSGVVALANALAVQNRTLRLLVLDQNQIGDVGVIAIARAVIVNTVLMYLSIRRNPPITYAGEEFLVDSVAKMRGLKCLWHGPIRRLANLKRWATAMESNHSLCNSNFCFWEDTFLEPDELSDELLPHMRPHWLAISLIGLSMRLEYDTVEISDIKIEWMAKYIPYITFLGQMNVRLRPFLFQPEESVPRGLWARVLTKQEPGAMFCMLRERPGLFVVTNA